MSIKASYEDLRSFWLDDACYRVTRGARLLDCPSEVSEEFAGRIKDAIPELEREHGVSIRCVGDEDGYEVQVAQYDWVFELLDLATAKGGAVEHAMYGVLLGYDGKAVDKYLLDRANEDRCEHFIEPGTMAIQLGVNRDCNGDGWYRCPECARYLRPGTGSVPS